MRDLLYSIYVLVIIYCALTIIYELIWDDPPVLAVKPVSIETDHVRGIPATSTMKFCF